MWGHRWLGRSSRWKGAVSNTLSPALGVPEGSSGAHRAMCGLCCHLLRMLMVPLTWDGGPTAHLYSLSAFPAFSRVLGGCLFASRTPSGNTGVISQAVADAWAARGETASWRTTPGVGTSAASGTGRDNTLWDLRAPPSCSPWRTVPQESARTPVWPQLWALPPLQSKGLCGDDRTGQRRREAPRDPGQLDFPPGETEPVTEQKGARPERGCSCLEETRGAPEAWLSGDGALRSGVSVTG